MSDVSRSDVFTGLFLEDKACAVHIFSLYWLSAPVEKGHDQINNLGFLWLREKLTQELGTWEIIQRIFNC